MDTETRNWLIEYISCQNNHRWFVVSCPADWTQQRVQQFAQSKCGVGDDGMAEILSVSETHEESKYKWLDEGAGNDAPNDSTN